MINMLTKEEINTKLSTQMSRLKYFRELTNVTIDKICRDTGINRNTYTKLERKPIHSHPVNFILYASGNRRSAIDNKDYEIKVHNKTLSVLSQSTWITSTDFKIDDESDDYYYIRTNKKLYQIAKAETR